MLLSAGDKLGPYEILAPIGAGGMGEVYRAHDSRLNRDVAIKVSNAQFTDRFTREARTIASLNHTNICHLYDVGPNYLVMEYVEGQDLRGPLDFDDALPIIRQLIDGIEAAHERNIIHRDLKPANIKITPEGVVKILDFGLAKAMEPPPSSDGNPENSPTLTMGATAVGTILGTAAYMAPEQAKGKTVDRRADIWSFGVVLYELLTGVRLFQGEDTAETLAAVLHKQPDLSQVPASVRRLLGRCLEKDPKKRLRDIGDASALVDEAGSQPASVSVDLHSRFRWLPWGIAALGILAALALAFVHFRETPAAARPVRFQIAPPEGMTFSLGTFAVSPDGQKVVVGAGPAGGPHKLWVRELDSLEFKPLAEIPAAMPPPFWSPDSRFVAFAVEGRLKKVDISGGPPQTICDVPLTNRSGASNTGGAWSKDGTIVFGVTVGGGLMRCPTAGGPASPVTALAPEENSHRFPQFLPDNRHFLYFRGDFRDANSVKRGVFIGSLDTKPDEQDLKPLLVTDRQAYYAPSETGGSGWLLFVREATLMAQPFDPGKLALSGEPVPIASPIGSYFVGNDAFFSVAGAGVLVYRSGGGGQTQLTWFDAQGRTSTLGEPGDYANPVVSPDGTRVAVTKTGSQGDRNIWVLDAVRGTSTRLTFDTAIDNNPVWSPDGTRIVFASNRGGRSDLYVKASDGSGDDQLLLKTDQDKEPESWSNDGQFLLYQAYTPKTGPDLWVLPMNGPAGAPGKPSPFLQTEFYETSGQFSAGPGGVRRWIAYSSNESGKLEVYVQPFSPDLGGGSSASGGKWMVSKDGGGFPRWSADGRQLFYSSQTGTVMAVDVTLDKAFHAGVPRRLFDSGLPNTPVTSHGMTPDGKRFLFPLPVGAGSTSTPYTVMLNWQAGLKK